MVELVDTHVSMKTKIKKSIIGLVLFVIGINSVQAKIVFKNEFLIEENGTEAFVIDSGDDVTGDLVLQFGSSLAETITFDTVNTWFEFSDDVNFNENQLIAAEIENVSALPGAGAGLGAAGEGRILILDTLDNTAPGCTSSPNCPANAAYIWDGSAWINIGGPGGLNLDDAYNNFGANTSSIIVDAAESQTGGITFTGSLGGDETITVTNSGNGGGMLVENTGTGDSFRVNDVGSDTSPFIIDDAGLVGVGIDTPVAELDVKGAIQNLNTGGFYVTWYDDTGQVGTFNGRQILQEIVSEANWANRDPNGQASFYTMRLVGYIQPEFSETYTFYGTSDDGHRLWVNGQLVIDQWVDQGATETSGTIALTAGEWYPIIAEHYENAGAETYELEWSSASQAREYIGTTASNIAYSGWQMWHAQNSDTGSYSETFTLDSDNVGGGNDVDIVANQGTDNDGTLRYNATLNQWELSNDGGAFQAIGTRVPDLYHYIDTTGDAVVAANNTTDYWDEGAENGTQHPNITPSLSTSEVLVMMTVSFDPNGNADESDVVRIERNIGSDPTCGSSTQVGDQMGWITSDDDVDGASVIYVDSPATTSPVFYTLCSDAESTDTGGTIVEIQFTLYEINDASDLAEVYATNDTSLISGDVVSFDPQLRAGVKKTEKSLRS